MNENKIKIWQKINGEFVCLGTVDDLKNIKKLQQEIQELKAENVKLKRELLGKNQTIKNFYEKQEKGYGQMTRSDRYEKQKDYHKR